MRIHKSYLTVLLLPALALAGCSSSSDADKKDDAMMSTSATSSAMSTSSEAPETSAAMDKDAKDGMKKDSMEKDAMKKDSMEKDAMNKGGEFVTYEQYMEHSDAAMHHDGRTVLFFDASWCPDCQKLKNALSSEHDVIPAGVTVVDVDYDSHNDLRKQYGVTMQHTFVEVDAQGNKVSSWSITDPSALNEKLAG
ncbi:thioredoxin domain-containing protein [Corynebacterium argentoratense]|uniref:thioredoxin domain-containing protein n=1 Tax=Corynebacterium argentoratense TaxID=42817 RepID=UPI001F3DF880|nr:thioredoxin domain-containing protein [Corynebacterium argentoratense]MCF1765176.1 thioredoxin domain-containing protein [Corynebacterium argentoratense]